MRFEWSWIDGGRDTAIALLMLVAGIAFVVAASRLIRGSPRATDDETLRNVAVAAAIGIIVIATVLPAPGRDDSPELKLLPFSNLINALAGQESVRLAVAEMAANVALFVPLGMALRWRFRTIGVTRIALVALAVSVVVEVVQALLADGRTTSTTDLIMNTLGGVVGALVAGIGRAPVVDD